jgi:hypothetical protein
MSPIDPSHQHHHSLRLPDYDYTQAGACFIAIVTGNSQFAANEFAACQWMSA